MQAATYFDKEKLLDLEAAVFSNTGKVKYCLIQTSQKYFYIGESVHIANLFPRIRSVFLNTEIDALAHNLQKTVRATNLADWVIAVFKDPNYPDHAIISKLKGFTQLHKAKRYEIHAKKDIKVFLLEHKRHGVQVYISSARDLTAGMINTRAKKQLKQRSKNIDAKTVDRSEFVQKIKLLNTALHAATGEWLVKEIEIKENPYNDIPCLVRSMNEKFMDLSFRV